MKELLSIIASALVFVSYAPYLRDIVKGKTKPHVYSWMNSVIVVGLLAALQLSEGAGWAWVVTLSAGLASLAIVVLSWKNGFKYITRVDTVLFGLSLITLGLWLIADQPALAATLLIAAEILGFIPTIRKAWHAPYEETLFTWSLNAIRHSLAIFALASFNYTTAIFPVVWAALNYLFAAMLILRRRAV